MAVHCIIHLELSEFILLVAIKLISLLNLVNFMEFSDSLVNFSEIYDCL
jgi:hypothetical protein